MEAIHIHKNTGLGERTNVGELLEVLKKLDPEMPVILSSDEEGNEHSLLMDIDTGKAVITRDADAEVYFPDQDVYDPKSPDYDPDEKIPENTVDDLVLYPSR